MNDTVLLVTKFGMGEADQTLQLNLAQKYFELLLQNGQYPSAICFYTDGVKLVCKGSPILEQLKALEAKNIRLVICSTCLKYFELTDQVQVGIVGGMGDILAAQFQAEKVITI